MPSDRMHETVELASDRDEQNGGAGFRPMPWPRPDEQDPPWLWERTLEQLRRLNFSQAEFDEFYACVPEVAVPWAMLPLASYRIVHRRSSVPHRPMLPEDFGLPESGGPFA